MTDAKTSYMQWGLVLRGLPAWRGSKKINRTAHLIIICEPLLTAPRINDKPPSTHTSKHGKKQNQDETIAE